jgi:putative ABC transport system permease protein
LAALQRTPDGVLLSAETLHDYQLHPGDLIRIRLQSGPRHVYRPIEFHVIGQVSEWPTAPKDSFIVANARYIATMTGSNAVGTFLISSKTPPATAAALRTQLSASTGARVEDISTARAGVTSATGLAGTDLSGLSRLELGFGVVLALACSGLALLGGIIERRRALVLLAALGATSRQRGRFLASEARAMVVAGMVGGALIGATIAYLLVKVLTGIFDPPPASAAVPWGYLTVLAGLVGAVTALVVSGVGRLVARAGPDELRDL